MYVSLSNRLCVCLRDLTLVGFFDGYNSMFPLFDKATFNKSYELQYSENPPSGTAWYACLNMVLCIGSLLLQVRWKDAPSGPREDQLWMKFFRNASGCFVDLLFEEGSLLAIQAICAMVGIQKQYTEY
jgi:hypothetical protein